MRSAVRRVIRAATSAAVATSGCVPATWPQSLDEQCDKAPATIPLEVTSDPNVNLVIVDRAYPQVLDFNEAMTWDGRLEHRALSPTFFCHQSERTVLALEAEPGEHKLDVLIRFRGNPQTDYAGITLDMKSEREIDVPEDGVIVVNLEVSLGKPSVIHGGSELLAPQLHYREVVLPAPARQK